jgi:hypothetical protein
MRECFMSKDRQQYSYSLTQHDFGWELVVLSVKLILELGVLKWVWHSRNPYRMFYFRPPANIERSILDRWPSNSFWQEVLKWVWHSKDLYRMLYVWTSNEQWSFCTGSLSVKFILAGGPKMGLALKEPVWMVLCSNLHSISKHAPQVERNFL